MKLSSVTTLASLIALVSAQPLEKRVLVVETKYEVVYETKYAYTTVVKSPDQAVKHHKNPHKHGYGHKPPAVVVSLSNTPPPAPKQTSTSTPPPQSTPPPAPASAPAPAPVKKPAAAHSPPVQSPKENPNPAPKSAPESKPAPADTPAPAPPAPKYTPPPPPPPAVKAPAPAVVQPSPTSTTSQAPPSYNPGSSGNCADGGSCTGDLTYYEAGLGSCGITSDGSVDNIFALGVGMMKTVSDGGNPNKHPWCGRMATVYNGGKSVVVKLTDTCAGCPGAADVDLSQVAYEAIAPIESGRIAGVQWHFND